MSMFEVFALAVLFAVLFFVAIIFVYIRFLCQLLENELTKVESEELEQVDLNESYIY